MPARNTPLLLVSLALGGCAHAPMPTSSGQLSREEPVTEMQVGSTEPLDENGTAYDVAASAVALAAIPRTKAQLCSLSMIAALALAACASSPPASELRIAAPAAEAARAGAEPVATDAPFPDASGPFAGVWQACDDTSMPEQCSRYVLQQRGERICGIWSYFASGALYQGRIVGRALSTTEARRTRICGRPGSETRTACEAGWEAIDRPLRLCDGKLGDLDGEDGACFADFERAEDAATDMHALSEAPWMQACLAGNEQAEVP
ncbi:hypothetical protein [Vulcaniibacterium gelatinicum]|uniref:hypothetical protein n=1 Tax=Vulcaniibacterium gelatinicum TaxID=2598725 RepID=UPI0011CBC0E4|nr:hypothetical protein [Vulcaniibacterium gelatinicum]